MMRATGLAALMILFAIQNTMQAAGPGPTYVVLKWTTEPKKSGTNLTMAGTVTFKNPWLSADNKVNVTITPTGGGVVAIVIVTLKADGTWSLDQPLAGFPAPAVD